MSDQDNGGWHAPREPEPVLPPATMPAAQDAPEYDDSSGGPFGGLPPAPPAGPERHHSEAKLPAWLWPAVSVLSLVLGLSGGAIAGAVVAGRSITHGDGSGGVLKVQRRTAAPLPPGNDSIASVAAKVLPSTVQIVAEYDGDAQGATGSGFVFDRQGHIITNNHVVAQAAADHGPIDVIDQAGRHHKATVIGRSAVYDIAVLKVPGAEKLTPMAIGSADQMRVGETVIAIGSPLGLSATVTSGIISAVHRPVTTGDGSDSSYISAVQTDAAINPGNSGGPLVNLQGQVVGVNSAIASLGQSSATGDESGNIGVGFAIPIEQAEITTDEILRTGTAEYPYIGADIRGNKTLDGATVESIASGAPADVGGLKVGDVITKIDGQPITGSIDLVVDIRTHEPGDKVTFSVTRNGHQLKVVVKLDAKTG